MNSFAVDDLASESDENLVGFARAGSLVAWNRLVERHDSALRRHLARRTGDSDVADDLAQDVFVIAWTHRDRLVAGQPFTPWLYRISHFVLLRWLRGARLLPDSLDALEEDGGCSLPCVGRGSAELAAVECSEVIEHLLLALPPTARQALLLHSAQGMTAREIALALHISEPAAEGRVVRASRAARRWGAAALALLAAWGDSGLFDLVQGLVGA